MANTVFGASSITRVDFTGSTIYFMCSVGGSIWDTTLEVRTQYNVRSAGDFSRMKLYVTPNAHNATFNAFFRVNTASVNNTVAVTASTTGWFEDTTHTDTVADGDDINFRASSTAGAGLAQIVFAGIEFNTNCAHYTFSNVQQTAEMSFSTASVSRYMPIMGSSDAASGFYSTELVSAKTTLRAAGTITNLQVRVLTNGRTTDSTATYRDNGAAGNNTVTVTASTTGLFEDTTHSDTVTAGNTGGYEYTTGTGASATAVIFFNVKFASDTSSHDISAAWTTTITHSTTVVTYTRLFGEGQAGTTEADKESRASYDLAFSFLRCGIGTSTSATDETGTFRNNGADGSQVVNITAGTDDTVFEDTTHSDTVTGGNEFCLAYSVANAASVQNDRWWAVTATAGTAIDADIAQTWGGWSQEVQALVSNAPGVIVQTWGGWSQALAAFTPNVRDNRAVFGSGI